MREEDGSNIRFGKADTEDQYPAKPVGYDRAAIVHGMCMTWRHDYGLLKDRDQCKGMSDAAFECMNGMTLEEKQSLHSRMDQVFEHHVKPFVAGIGAIQRILKILAD